jgi:hypothetical protein
MREDPDAFQHDGGYASPILGKQKMAERSESPGAGEPKRQRGSLVSFIKENQQQWTEVMELAVKNEELEKMDNEKTTQIKEISAERDSFAAKHREAIAKNEVLAIKNEEITIKINDFLVERASLVNELADVKKELATKSEEMIIKINGFSAEKAKQINELVTNTKNLRMENAALVKEVAAKTNENDELKRVNSEISAEKDGLVNELAGVNRTKTMMNDSVNMSLSLCEKYCGKCKKLEEENAKLKEDKDRTYESKEFVVNHFQQERAMWKETVKDRELKIVQLESGVRNGGDFLGTMIAAMEQHRLLMSKPLGVTGDLGIDVVVLDDAYLRNIWVFRFKIESGKKNVSEAELAIVFATQVLKKCELVTINDEMYVFMKLTHVCNAGWLKDTVETYFDTANYLAVICPSSRAASNVQCNKQKKWTEHMFHFFISRIRAAGA